VRNRTVLIPLAVAVALLIATLPRAARAQTPPARFYGAVTLNGAPAPGGVEVVAYVGEVECGRTTTTNDGRYVLDVNADGTVPGCGTDDATVRFVVNGVPADQTGVFQTGHFIQLDLSVGGAPAAPAEAPAAEQPAMEEAPSAEPPAMEEAPPAEPPSDEMPPAEQPME
jgi:hypothetical protein